MSWDHRQKKKSTLLADGNTNFGFYKYEMINRIENDSCLKLCTNFEWNVSRNSKITVHKWIMASFSWTFIKNFDSHRYWFKCHSNSKLNGFERCQHHQLRKRIECHIVRHISSFLSFSFTVAFHTTFSLVSPSKYFILIFNLQTFHEIFVQKSILNDCPSEVNIVLVKVE